MSATELPPFGREQVYRDALGEIEGLIDAAGTREYDRLESLSVRVADYADRHRPTEATVSFLELVRESRALPQKDIAPFIGSRACMEEFMTLERGLYTEMVRPLSNGLDLSAIILIQPGQTAFTLADA